MVSHLVRPASEHAQNRFNRPHAELDLTDQSAVAASFKHEVPDDVFLATGKVGGACMLTINTLGEFIRDNLAVQTNIIKATDKVMVERLLFLGDSYHLESSHALPALIHKCHETIVSTTPSRELLYSKDKADACVFPICWMCSSCQCLGRTEMRSYLQ